jgi:hypothetical protein
MPQQPKARPQSPETIDAVYTVLPEGGDPQAALRDLVARERPTNYDYAGKTYELTEPELAAKYPNGVPFKELGFPDFSQYTYSENGVRAEVQIAMQGNREYGPNGDFANANEAAGFARSRSGTPEGYTWHHVEDRTTMQLVPFDLHFNVGHYGGVWVIDRLGTL